MPKGVNILGRINSKIPYIERQVCHSGMIVGSEKKELLLEKMNSVICARRKSGIAIRMQQEEISDYYGNKQ